LTVSVPTAVGVHLGSGTYGQRSPLQRHLAGFSRGYLLRRYGVLRRAAAPRALLTETIVVAADAVVCHDLQALRGRVEGWRAARGKERHPWPAQDSLERSITLSRSLAMRRSAVRARET
jgi:hypothetical protein